MVDWQLSYPIDVFTVTCYVLILVSLFFIASNVTLSLMLRFYISIWGRQKIIQGSAVRSISIIVPAYNEEKNIIKKINSICAALQGIDVDVEIIIGSDGSTDQTMEIAAAHLQNSKLDAAHWRLLKFDNEGKCSTINKLVKEAKGEVIISTDADIHVPEDALKLIIQAFQSRGDLGCVSSVPMFDAEKPGSQQSYWNLEGRIRSAESALGKLIVVTGWLFAFRRREFEEIPAGVMADDLWIPLTILLKGSVCTQIDLLRVLSEATDEQTEIKRRKRVMSGGMDVVRRLWPRIVRNPAILFLVLTHKINRWALPLWLTILLGATTALLPLIWFFYALIAGCAFLLLGREKIYTLAYAGISPILSFAEVMRRSDFARWEHTRKH